jgi:hypothetical protein
MSRQLPSPPAPLPKRERGVFYVYVLPMYPTTAFLISSGSQGPDFR